MKKILKWLLLSGVVLALQGCLYANVQHPLDTNFDQTQLGKKTGKASMHSVLWLFAWGDAGSQAAAENGGIKVINHADTRTLIILGPVYSRVTTVVYGD